MMPGKSSLGLGRYIASDGPKDADENARIHCLVPASIPLGMSKSAIGTKQTLMSGGLSMSAFRGKADFE